MVGIVPDRRQGAWTAIHGMMTVIDHDFREGSQRCGELFMIVVPAAMHLPSPVLFLLFTLVIVCQPTVTPCTVCKLKKSHATL